MRTKMAGVLRKVQGALITALAVSLDLAGTALAGSGVGGVFNLGKTNTVNAVTSLTGSVAGDQLKVSNGNTTSSYAVAIDAKNTSAAGPAIRSTNSGGGPAASLWVNAGKAPLNVNSTGKVTNLNADLVDGRDSSTFMPSKVYGVYNVSSSSYDPTTMTTEAVFACDSGDVILSGGYSQDGNVTILQSGPYLDLSIEDEDGQISHHGWVFSWRRSAEGGSLYGYAWCADQLPYHNGPY